MLTLHIYLPVNLDDKRTGDTILLVRTGSGELLIRLTRSLLIMTKKFIDERIVCERLTSGQHAGWWCAELLGLGIFAPSKLEAIASLKNVLYCAKRYDS